MSQPSPIDGRDPALLLVRVIHYSFCLQLRWPSVGISVIAIKGQDQARSELDPMPSQILHGAKAVQAQSSPSIGVMKVRIHFRGNHERPSCQLSRAGLGIVGL